MKNITIVVFLLFISHTAKAVYIDLNLGILQGQLDTTANSGKNVRNLNSLGFYAHLNKSEAKSGFLLGWNMTNVTVNDEFSSVNFNQKLTSTDMGPSFRWYLEKEIIYSVSYFYGISCKADYELNGASEKLSGTSQNIKIAAEVKMSDRFLIGFSLNNYTANYSTSVSNNIQSDVSYKNTWLYPSLNLAFQF